MFKHNIVVILLHILLTKEAEAKDDTIDLREWHESATLFDDAIGNCTQRPTRRSKLFFATPPTYWIRAMSNCKLNGMTLFEWNHDTPNLQGRNIHATGEEGWYWTGLNAINNVAYGADVQVPEFTWRWFSTGIEVPKDFEYWLKGEPRQGFDQVYQSYVGCAAMNVQYEMKTFHCHTPLPYICEELWEG